MIRVKPFWGKTRQKSDKAIRLRCASRRGPRPVCRRFRNASPGAADVAAANWRAAVDGGEEVGSLRTKSTTPGQQPPAVAVAPDHQAVAVVFESRRLGSSIKASSIKHQPWHGQHGQTHGQTEEPDEEHQLFSLGELNEMTCIRTFTRESALNLSFVVVLPHSDVGEPVPITIHRSFFVAPSPPP
jgi:hypothetical protein